MVVLILHSGIIENVVMIIMSHVLRMVVVVMLACCSLRLARFSDGAGGALHRLLAGDFCVPAARGHLLPINCLLA